MSSASFNGYTYFTNDPVFIYHINNGITEPYPVDLEIVNKYFKMFPHKNGTYIDVGAHIGTTIIPYTNMFKRIIGFDACSDNFKFLEKNIQYNNITNCEIYNHAIYKETCNGNMYVHGSNSGCYFLKIEENGSTHCKKLDDVMEDKNIENVDFLKIDTEGAELFVLEGAKRLIEKYKPFIQFQVNELSKVIYNIDEQDIVIFLKKLGYLPFNIEKKGANVFFYHPNETLSIIPKHLYCFWTGKNEMSNNRRECFEQMKNITDTNVKLISNQEVYNYMIPSNPFHPAFEYLSETHKADYLRMYFMHYYGGGYADIKKQTSSWAECYNKLLNTDLIGIGYPEINELGIAYPPVSKYWNMLIGNCSYIFKPNTDFTRKWLNDVHILLDSKLDELKKNPSSFPQDCKEKGTGYPIEWNEMLGRIFHRLNYEFKEKITGDLPTPIFRNYR